MMAEWCSDDGEWSTITPVTGFGIRGGAGLQPCPTEIVFDDPEWRRAVTDEDLRIVDLVFDALLEQKNE